MGFTIGDTITLDTGFSVKNAYASFGACEIELKKEKTDRYRVSGILRLYYDSSKRTAQVAFDSKQYKTILTEAELSSNLYDKLYAVAKADYETTTDV